VRVVFYLLPVLLLVTVGMAITILIKTADLKGEWRLMTEPTAFTSGKVLDMEMRKSSKGSITYLYEFEFNPVGREVSDAAVKGICFSGNQVASPGQAVHIEYIPNDPKISRIEGCRLNPMPLAGIIAMPLLGVITAVLPIGMLRYKKKWLLRLLTFGVPTPAIIEKVKPGPKGALVVEVRYDVGGMEFKSKTNTSGRKHAKEWLTSLHESGRPAMILVAPNKPRSIILLDLLLDQGKGKWFGLGG